VQFAAGVLLITVPIASAAVFALTTAIQTKALIDQYQGLNITIDITLENTVALMLLVALSIAGAVYGSTVIRRSRDGGQGPPSNPLGL
jgi:hypothetical protein